MDRPDRHHAAGIAESLRKRGDQILVQIELERLRRGLEPALLEQDWAALIPRESAPPLDRDRLLALADSKADDALEQIRVMLAPDPTSIIQGLRMAGILEETGADRLLLRPAWVANTINHIAIDMLHRSGPEGLGTLLLFPGTSEDALAAFINEVRAGNIDRVATCAAMTDPRTPEQMAALDGAFRAIGFALQAGADVPQTLIRMVWDRQMQYVSRRFTNWPPLPVLAIAPQHPWRGATSPSAWFLAAFEISHALSDASVTIPPSALNPWSRLPEAPDERACCMEALNNIAMVFGQIQDAASHDLRQLVVYRLGGDLFDRHGVLRRNTTLLDLQAPDLLVELARGTKLEISDSERDKLAQLRCGLRALEDACGRRQVSLDSVLTWCWSRWSAATGPCPPLSWLDRPDGGALLEDTKRLWSAAPASALSSALYEALATRMEIWAWLPHAFWVRWLEIWGADPGRWSKNAEPFSRLPESLALQALRNGQIDALCHDVRAVLWGRMPDALIALIDELSTIAPTHFPVILGSLGTVCDLAWSAPERHGPALIERARRWLSSPASYPGTSAWVHQWLMHLIQQRLPGWRDAHETLIARLAERTLDGALVPSSESSPSPERPVTKPIHPATEPPDQGRTRPKPPARPRAPKAG